MSSASPASASAHSTQPDIPDIPDRQVAYSESVNAAIAEVMHEYAPQGTAMATTMFDQPSFNAVEFINQLFPNEQSLEQLDPFVQKLRRKIMQVDDEILTAVRRQSTAGVVARRDLEEAKTSISSLFSKVQEIKTKAEQSEFMVQDLTKNIRSLDYAKRNLTASIKALRRFHMLATAVEQLRRAMKKRQYKRAAQHVEAIHMLSADFENFRGIAKIRELSKAVDELETQLRDQIFGEFKSMDAAHNTTNSPKELLADAAACIDALGEKARKQLIQTYVKEKQMDLYRMIFQKRAKDASLEFVSKRYNWLKRRIKEFEEALGSVFPKGWYVPQEITVEFCLQTRSDLEEFLKENKDNLDGTMLHQAMTKTIAFEREMHSRFHVTTEADLEKELNDYEEEESSNAKDGHSTGMKTSDDVKRHFKMLVKQRNLEEMKKKGGQPSAAEDDTGASSLGLKRAPKPKQTKNNYNFLGFISTVFEEYMGSYVQFEDKTAREKFVLIMSQEKWDFQQPSNSAQGLFYFISECVRNAEALSKGATMLKLIEQVWKKLLRDYADELLRKIPRVKVPVDASQAAQGAAGAAKESMAALFKLDFGTLVDRASGTSDLINKLEMEQIQLVCFIIHVANYCQENIEAMEEELKKKIDEAYKNQVDLSEETAKFLKVIKTCIETLVMSTLNALEPQFTQMLKTPWSTVETVGDQSPYISVMIAYIRDVLPPVAAFIPRNHFSYLCDNLAVAFSQYYMSIMMRSKKLTGSAIGQLQVDTGALQSFLKVLINVGDPGRFDEDELASFSKKVQTRMSRTETILKLLQYPPEAITQAYNSMIVDGSPQELQRIFEMKGSDIKVDGANKSTTAVIAEKVKKNTVFTTTGNIFKNLTTLQAFERRGKLAFICL